MNKPALYEIRVESHLDSGWSYWFEGLTIRHELNGETVLSGPTLDQAALQVVLGKIHELNLKLISVNRAESLCAKPC